MADIGDQEPASMEADYLCLRTSCLVGHNPHPLPGSRRDRVIAIARLRHTSPTIRRACEAGNFSTLFRRIIYLGGAGFLTAALAEKQQVRGLQRIFANHSKRQDHASAPSESSQGAISMD